ncbi:MAG: hypothetical protein ACI89J_001978 [Hyphomicrobiaceae bacterium]|jgi:hypothetical protein
MIHNHHRSLAGAMFAVVLAAVATSNAIAGPIELLPGRWTGWGEMTMDGGEVEKIKCVATYFREDGGRELRHNLRCASTNYRIDAKANLNVSSGKVTGQWEERTYSTGGAVTGEVVGDGISVNIVGQAFKASLKVETSKCKQTMNIEPKGMGVARIAVDLAKC